jgi:hypothetical protein
MQSRTVEWQPPDAGPGRAGVAAEAGTGPLEECPVAKGSATAATEPGSWDLAVGGKYQETPKRILLLRFKIGGGNVILPLRLCSAEFCVIFACK